MEPGIKTILLTYLIYCQAFECLSKFTYEFNQFDNTTEKLTALLGNCKELRISNIIFINMDSPESFQWTGKSLKKVSLINFDDIRLHNDSEGYSYWPQKLDAFVIIAPSMNKLQNLLKKLRSMIWWNPMALFIQLDTFTTKASCKNAFSFLRATWKYDILSSTFFCVDPEKGFTMFTFNPFTNYAPKHWEKVATDNQIGTIYRQKFIPGNTTCGMITFDKTRKLGGFPIKLLALSNKPLLTIDSAKEGIDQLDGFDAEIINSFWSKLNVSFKLTSITNYSSHEISFRKLETGTYDLMANSHFQTVLDRWYHPFTAIYPHMHGGMSIMTKYPTYQATYKKIINFMNPIFIGGILLVASGTVIILNVFLGQELISSSLEVLRMILGHSMLRVPQRNAWRIYMVSLLFLFLVSISTFNGNLASLLTSNVPENLLDSIQDLRDSRYPIYIPRLFSEAIFDTVLYSRRKEMESIDCATVVLKSEENIACVDETTRLILNALENGLHVSAQRISTLFRVFPCRNNWPLKERVGSMLMHLYQTGWTKQAWNLCVANMTYQNLIILGHNRVEKTRNLTLDDLSFAFNILFIGLSLSLAFFIVELYIWHRQSVRNKKKIRLPFKIANFR